MTSQEMMLPWFGVIADLKATPSTIATYVPPDLDSLPRVTVIQHGVGRRIARPTSK
jgi:hypothetical protein